jgi:hypothetical protein
MRANAKAEISLGFSLKGAWPSSLANDSKAGGCLNPLLTLICTGGNNFTGTKSAPVISSLVTQEDQMNTMVTKRALGALAILAALIAGPSTAGPLSMPADKPILTISGSIQSTNKDGAAQFDRAMLESLGMVGVETSTPWHNGRVKFEGVSLDKLMKHVGATGQRVVAVALNDYSTEIPIEDFAKYGAILALKRDGEYMPVKDKGPLFIIYPYDSKPELKSQTYYGRSAWQVAKLVVK